MIETADDLAREKKAIATYVARFKGSYKKLSPMDIDFKFFDADRNLMGYAEVKGRSRLIKDAYPLPVSARKIVKLSDKRLNPIIIWACEDGIIYGSPTKLNGEVKWGGRAPRSGFVHDEEVMIYYPKQRNLKYIRYY